ncbi:MAG: fibronectin type III-like domain-contianing protein [Clostridia bacterium]|nr:fibronectin type III-like domain-contianing protein [Clostridia bacterium]
MDFPVDPLYSFGHGLSYTKYKYGNLKLDATEMTKDSSITVSIDVTNIGTRCGNETIMMFIHDKFAQVSRPVKELKRFEKISLNPGETKTVSFIITNDALTYVHPDLSTYSDPGEFDIMVGPNSEDTLNTIIKLV